MLPPSTLFAGLPLLEGRGRAAATANEWTARLRAATDVAALAAFAPALDREWRRQRALTKLTAAQYGRVLATNPVAGFPLPLSYKIAHCSGDPVSHLAHAANLLNAGHREWAVRYIVEILSQYAPEADAAIIPLLDAIVKKLDFAGWAAYSAEGRFLVRLPASRRRGDETITTETGFLTLRPGTSGCWRATLGGDAPAPQALRWRDRPLLVANLPPAGVVSLDGRCDFARGRLRGWLTHRRAPGLAPVALARTPEATWQQDLVLRATDFGVWSFDAAVPAAVRKVSRMLDVLAVLPAAGERRLPDAPVQLQTTVPVPAPVARRAPATAAPSIVIPVYNNLADSVRAITAARALKPAGWSLIVIDDASTDPAVAPALDAFAEQGDVRLLRNRVNGGYAQAVNRGIAAAHGDVVLLNSDALLFPGVLEHLHAVAVSDPRIGTVTAPSTDDSVAGLQLSASDETAIAAARQLHRTLSVDSAAAPIEVPTGVGHCLYIKRACLDEVGTLDAEAFPAGYGEETDFCFRATALGWRHVVATGAFVFHAGGRSFASRRKALLDRGDAIMRRRHPEYAARVAACVTDPALARFKRGLQEQLLRAATAPITLIVAPRLWGGVDRAVAAQCDRLRRQGHTPLVLHPGNDPEAGELHLACTDLGLPTLVYVASAELATLQALLAWLPVERVQVHHFVGIPFALLEQLMSAGAAPVDVFVHDYAWACPRLHLMGPQGAYCGLPSARQCQACIRQQGSLLQERIGVTALRARSAAFLAKAERVFVVSEDIRDRLAAMLGLSPYRFTLHALETPIAPRVSAPPRASRPRLRIALMGSIGLHKGYAVLLACARDARRRRLPLDFVVVGHSHDDRPLRRLGNIELTGPYTEPEAEHLLRQADADVFFCASVIPESWCYTLSYALRLGLPVVSFDIGAQAQRLRGEPGARLVPLATTAAQLNDLFLERVPEPVSP